MARLVIRAQVAWLGPGRAVPDVQVTCEGGTIVEVGRVRPVLETDELIVADGFLMPAGADRHVHVELGDPVTIVPARVTAVRDLGWPAERIFPMVDASELPGFTGRREGGRPDAHVRRAEIRRVQPGRRRARGSRWPTPTARRRPWDLAARGAAAIKVSLNAEAGPTVGDAVLTAICDAAREHDLPGDGACSGRRSGRARSAPTSPELAHTPWSERLDDSTIATAAERMRWVSTLDIHAFGRDSPEVRCALDNLARFHRAGGDRVRHGPRQRPGAIRRARDRAAVAAPGGPHDRAGARGVRAGPDRARGPGRPAGRGGEPARRRGGARRHPARRPSGRDRRLVHHGLASRGEHRPELVEAAVDIGLRVEEVRTDAQAVAAEVGAHVAGQQLVADRASIVADLHVHDPAARGAARGVCTASPASSLRAIT